MMRCSISVVSVLFILTHTGVNQRGSGCLLLSPPSFVCVCVCVFGQPFSGLLHMCLTLL